ncbi:MAG TPA: DinB family protein [Dehalococcoidia bacterium]|nr:DinB family protein [Dehalococcoidia bacterium]
MGAQAETLAAKFQQENDALIAAIEGLSDAQWQALTNEEGWTVAATAHHVAGGHQAIAGLVQAHANGQGQPVSFAALNEGNAQHARQFKDASKSEVLELMRSGGTAAAAIVHGLSDEQLARTGQFADALPAMPVQNMIEMILIGHVQGHGASIRNAG